MPVDLPLSISDGEGVGGGANTRAAATYQPDSISPATPADTMPSVKQYYFFGAGSRCSPKSRRIRFQRLIPNS
jgi:hypothetical protein